MTTTDPTGADFPAEFLWGAATAAHQVEGGNVNNDWWDFEHDPSSAARESSGDGIDQYHRYADDFALLKSLGHNCHRLSLEWSRIEPAPGEFSQGALSHYRRVLTALADAGLTGFVTLHHFTLWSALEFGDELEAAHQFASPAKYLAAWRRISRSDSSLVFSARNAAFSASRRA